MDDSLPHELAGNGRFSFVRRLGAGGMGVVYEAVDRERNARVALKTLRSFKPDALLRFKNEFRSLQDIQHPNLVSLGELFEEHGQWFFTMEMVRGVHFLDYVRRPEEGLRTGASTQATDDTPTVNLPRDMNVPLPAPAPSVRLASGADERRLRDSMAQLALGLVALHRANKVHRDIKPANILVTAEGRVVILDFGLVVDTLTSLPEANLVGTFSYMAPEQAGLRAIGPAADWYSVGVLLFQALTGRLPVKGDPREILMLKQSFEAPAPSVFADVPPDLDALCSDLLRIDPSMRPPAAEILRRLEAREAPYVADFFAGGSHFVGRRDELEALRGALRVAREGRGATVFVHGESGIGKSALARHFAEGLTLAVPGAIVFSDRCYERESVPYKAFDGIVDALSRHLTTLTDDELAAVLPRQRGLLGQVFPVLRKVAAIADAPRPIPGALDPQVLRARLFLALRELFSKLSEHAPLLLIIDDLQRADADSLALLAELMRAPDAPRLLLIGTMRAALTSEARRSDEEHADLKVRSVEHVASLFTGEVRRLHITNLPREDARALVDTLLREASAGAGVSAAAVADEASGHPLFIDELVRRKLMLGAHAGTLRLEEALAARVDRLEGGPRRLLELVAVAGAPLLQDTAAQAARVSFSDFAQEVGLLRAQNLVRTDGVHRTDLVEPYHDRVREAVLVHLDPETRRGCHARLALAIEASQSGDSEALAMHWRGAGDSEKAADYAVRAAGEAAEAFAFDRAARLYQLALELRPLDGPLAAEGGALRAKLGDALANAGRGAEAAAAYLVAATTVRSADEGLDLRRRAADQLLRSGHIDESMAVFRTVLTAVGMDLPETPRRALAALLLRRTQVRLRGLAFHEHGESDIPASVLTRIDTCLSAAAGLGLVNTIVGSYFNARALLLALDAGEPHRIARLLALEAAYSSASGGASQARTRDLLARTSRLASRLAHPYALGWSAGAEGIAGTLEGRWQTGHEACDRAELLFRDRCTGATWESGTMRWFSLWSLANEGKLDELARRIPVRLREASDRGDLYATICHTTGLANLTWLAADDPGQARERNGEAMRKWSQKTFHVEHWWAMLADRQIDLYSGDGEAAHRGVLEQWPALSSSLLLMCQLTKIEALHLRARSALQLARQRPSSRKALCRSASDDARHIEKERMAWSRPVVQLLRAGVAATEGDTGLAATLLAASAVSFDEARMALYAAAARYRRGELLGGDEGRGLVAKAAEWMKTQGIIDQAKMVGMLAPGFVG